MKCTVSQENYLKAIYLLQIQKESVRAVDVSNYMALSKPSVSNALKKLRTERLLTVDKEKNLILTDEGLQAAREIFSRHSFLSGCSLTRGWTRDRPMRMPALWNTPSAGRALRY